MTGEVVGRREPPLGSWVTSTSPTPSSEPGTTTEPVPSARGTNSAEVGSGALPGRLSQTR